jgi:hypothetical protein
MSPSYGGSSPVVETAAGGVSAKTNTLTGGRAGIAGAPIATGGGTSVQVFTTPSAQSSSTTPSSGLPD